MKHDTMLTDPVSKLKITSLTKEQADALILRVEENKLTEEDRLILRKFFRHRTVRITYKILLMISRLKDFLSLRDFLCPLKRKNRK